MKRIRTASNYITGLTLIRNTKDKNDNGIIVPI